MTSVFQTNLSINELGQAAFLATMTGTIGGLNDDSAIFRGAGGSLTKIVRENDLVPDGDGRFSSFGSSVALNDVGVVALNASLRETSGGSSIDSGIYLGDGTDLIEVIREGTLIDGQPASLFFFSENSFPSSGSSLNDFGQLAYVVQAGSTQRVRLFTPDLHWRHPYGSLWNSAGNWTLGLAPAHVHDVFIDPAATLTVSGPASDTTVRKLQIGGGAGLATLSLRYGSVLTATGGVTIEGTGTLTGDGTIGGNLDNNGTVLANNLTVAGTLNNDNVIRGSGRIDASLINRTTGKIRALAGSTLWFSGPSFSNLGLVEVDSAELQIDAPVNNLFSSGLISVRDGSLIADAGIVNTGSLAFTLGDSTVQGDIANDATGFVQVSGGAHATFFGDLVQNGTMQVAKVGSTSSTAVILGSFSGANGFVGGGDVFALGDLRPGNSPASVLYDGNLFLGAGTDTFIELGGLTVGDFDQMIVTGDLTVAGNLFVSLLGGYSLGPNQAYLIGDVGGLLDGQFDGLGEGDMVGNFGGRDLFITYAAGNGNDIGLYTAIPEPTSLALLLASVIGIGSLLRKRRR